LAEQRSELGLRHRPVGDFEECEIERALRVRDPVSVERKKSECGVNSRSLIPVDESLRFCDVERVGGGHREQVVVQVFAVERSLRLHDRRFERASVTDAIGAAPTFDLGLVKPKDVIQR